MTLKVGRSESAEARKVRYFSLKTAEDGIWRPMQAKKMKFLQVQILRTNDTKSRTVGKRGSPESQIL